MLFGVSFYVSYYYVRYQWFERMLSQQLSPIDCVPNGLQKKIRDVAIQQRCMATFLAGCIAAILIFWLLAPSLNASSPDLITNVTQEN